MGITVQQLAKLRGATNVHSMDKDPQRLGLAETFGMIPVDTRAHLDVAEYILSDQDQGLDRSIELGGFSSTQKAQHASMRATGRERGNGDTSTPILTATRKGGNSALIEDFFTTHDFPIGSLMQKSLTVRGGQTWPQKVGWVFASCVKLDQQLTRYRIIPSEIW